MKAGNMVQIISAVSHLSLPELEQVFDHVLALQAAQGGAFVSSRIGVARPHESGPTLSTTRTHCLSERQTRR